MPTIGGKEYDPASLVGLAMSYGSPDLAWFAGGTCLGFTPDTTALDEWDAAVEALGDAVLRVGPSPEGHLTVLSPALVTEAIYEPGSGVLRASAGGRRIRVAGINASQYRDFVAGMPGDAWHTPVPKAG